MLLMILSTLLFCLGPLTSDEQEVSCTSWGLAGDIEADGASSS